MHKHEVKTVLNGANNYNKNMYLGVCYLPVPVMRWYSSFVHKPSPTS